MDRAVRAEGDSAAREDGGRRSNAGRGVRFVW